MDTAHAIASIPWELFAIVVELFAIASALIIMILMKHDK